MTGVQTCALPILALLGAFLLATHGSLTALALSPQALFWGLCAAVALMLYTLLPGDLLRRYDVSVCTGCGMLLGGVVLEIAGIMSEEPLVDVNHELENAKEKAFALGVSRGVDPFMTLSFMALPVIPTLRLTTRGVFDTVTQKYV